MESVGQELREQRIRIGLTLEQVSARTRISIKNLEAIENDELQRISSPFFYKSFVRQFAQQLNLDYNLLAPGVQSAVSTMPEPLIPGHNDAALPKIPALHVSRPKNWRWLSSLATFTVMLVGCSAVYAVWQNAKSNWRGSLDAVVRSFHSKALVHKASITAPQKAAQKSTTSYGSAAEHTANQSSKIEGAARASAPQSFTARGDSAPAPQAQVDTAVHLQVSALERTWLSIVADGKQLFSGNLEPDETKVLEARETARIRTGNAGGLNVVFNGKEIGTVGPRGQVRTVIFTQDNYEVLQPSPHIALTSFHFSTE